MSFVNQFQTLSKEDATKALFDVLNNKAMDVISSMREGYDKVYSQAEKKAMVKKSNAEWLNSKSFKDFVPKQNTEQNPDDTKHPAVNFVKSIINKIKGT